MRVLCFLFALSLATACEPPPPSPDASAPDAAPTPDAGSDAGPPDVPPRLVLASREGELVSTDLVSPWTVRASRDLAHPVASVRCGDGRCYVVHPSPTDAITVVDASDLSVVETLTLDAGADPRDVALAGGTLVVTQYGAASLRVIDLATHARTAIDLASLADDDGLPEAGRIAVCGRRSFVQLRRVDHESGTPASTPAVLAVIDLDDADPIRSVALRGRPAFDMPVDCAAGVLRVAEPMPVLAGGSHYDEVDLATLTAHPLELPTSAEVGGFESMGGGRFWVITHTDFGPGASSHLGVEGGDVIETYNTFANEHVDELALDVESDLLFFPDPCSTAAYPACEGGLVPFVASTGARASAHAIDVGIAPIEIALSR